MLNTILALEIWHRRRPISDESTNVGCSSTSNDENSTEKRATSDTNTISGKLYAQKVGMLEWNASLLQSY